MNEIEEIKSRLPVEQVVGRYVPLKKAGRVFKGLCPFHGEKTPSFTVNPERGIWKCFGCGKGGDIFDFMVESEGLTFGEALRLLAEQAGVKLEEKTLKGSPAPTGPSKSRLFALNEYVAKLWHHILTQHPKAETAREYMKGRGLTSESIERFQIGYAPVGQTSAEGLRKQGFTREEVQAAGDPSRFQDRIVFPIADITGRVIGFTGRLLEVADDPRGNASRGPKYWNTPETPLFNKSRAVFALHLAKQAIQEADVAIMAEGQMDVVMLHQAGYHNAVASSGTALTSQQLRLIARFSSNLAFAYDGDKAGREATKKGIELALNEELNPYVISIPNGKDPAECIQKDAELWKQAYEARAPFMQWLLEEIVPTGTALTPQSKKEAAKQLLPWLRLIKDDIERADWLRIIAARLQTDEKNLEAALAARPASLPPLANASVGPAETVAAAPLSPLQLRAELGLAILLNFPSLYPHVTQQLTDLRLAGETPFLKLFFDRWNPEVTDFEAFIAQLPGDIAKDLSLHAEEVLKTRQEAFEDTTLALEELLVILQRLRSDSKEAKKAEMARLINAAQVAGDMARVKSLLADLKNMI